MSIEEESPNKPNFKLIVILFAGSIILILLLAVLFIKRDPRPILPSGKASPGSSYFSPSSVLPEAAVRHAA